MSEVAFIAEHAIGLSVTLGALCGFTVTETVKRDRRRRKELKNLNRIQLRVVASAVTFLMTMAPLMQFSTLGFMQSVVIAAECAVLFTMVTAGVMILIEKRMPGLGKSIQRAASGDIDDTTITKGTGDGGKT